MNTHQCWNLKLPDELRDPELIKGFGYAVYMILRGERPAEVPCGPCKTTRVHVSLKASRFVARALELRLAANRTELARLSLAWLKDQPKFFRKTRI